MFCSNCGKDIANDSKFCAHCGTTVASSNFSAEPVLEKTQTKSSNTQANAASTSDVNNAAHSIAAVALNSKSVGLAFLLTAFFGPLGMLYSTITGGLLMLILPIPIFVGMFTSISGFVFGLMFFVFYWLICIVWGMIAASSHNKNLLNAVTQGTEFKANASYTPIYIAIGIAIIGSVWVYSENSKPSKPIAEKFAEGFAEGFTSSIEKSLTAPTEPQPLAENQPETPTPAETPSNSSDQTLPKQEEDCVMADGPCWMDKFDSADKQLNNVYKRVMASLSLDKKASLKSEQRAWIKEKETKCGELDKDFTVAYKVRCEFEMTEERIIYLDNYR